MRIGKSPSARTVYVLLVLTLVFIPYEVVTILGNNSYERLGAGIWL
jgi:hypothetical protein